MEDADRPVAASRRQQAWFIVERCGGLRRRHRDGVTTEAVVLQNEDGCEGCSSSVGVASDPDHYMHTDNLGAVKVTVPYCSLRRVNLKKV